MTEEPKPTSITADEAIEYALKNDAQGISLGLAKTLQSERNHLASALRTAEARVKELEAQLAGQKHLFELAHVEQSVQRDRAEQAEKKLAAAGEAERRLKLALKNLLEFHNIVVEDAGIRTVGTSISDAEQALSLPPTKAAQIAEANEAGARELLHQTLRAHRYSPGGCSACYRAEKAVNALAARAKLDEEGR